MKTFRNNIYLQKQAVEVQFQFQMAKTLKKKSFEFIN